MAEKKYVGAEALIRLVAQLKNGFAQATHKHGLNDIEDYAVDSSLSTTSANPVQNKVVASKFDDVYTKSQVDSALSTITNDAIDTMFDAID